MTEILWNTNSPHSSLRDHELVELRLVDLGGTTEHRYLVREVHATWSSATQEIEWKGFKDRVYLDQEQAKHSFLSLKVSALSAGFPFATSFN